MKYRVLILCLTQVKLETLNLDPNKPFKNLSNLEACRFIKGISFFIFLPFTLETLKPKFCFSRRGTPLLVLLVSALSASTTLHFILTKRLPQLTPAEVKTQPYTLNPLLSTFNLQPSALSPQPSTLNLQPSNLNPQPSTFNHLPSTLNPQPSALDPRPKTLNSQP